MDTPYFGSMINIIGCCGHHIYAHEIDICTKKVGYQYVETCLIEA